MTALALHLPERKGIARWCLAAVAIVAAHAAIVAAIVAWYTRSPPEQREVPAIAITFAPPTSAYAPDEDKGIGVPQEHVDARPPEPPQIEQPVEKPIEQAVVAPPKPTEVTLPKAAPKEVKEQKRPVEQRQPQEARAATPKSDAPQQSSVAAALQYSALVSGHLRRFTRADAAKLGTGRVTVRFVLSRQGQVISSSVASSSGNAALDREALAIVSRANPFPPFPAEKAGAQDSFTWPVTFSQR